MALSLDDIKKNKIQRKKSIKKKVAPKAKKKATSKAKKGPKIKTKPWQKTDDPASANEPFKPSDQPSLTLEKVLKWGRSIKIYPSLEIPVPDFLLTEEDS